MSLEDTYGEAWKRASKRLQQTRQNARFHGGSLSAPNQQLLSDFQSRLDAVDEFVESTGRRAADVMRDFEQRRVAPSLAESVSFQSLPVPSQYKLDAASAEFRHSIGQAALGSLRMFGQQVPEKRLDAAFRDKLKSAFDRVAGVRAQAQAYFDYEVAPALLVRRLFPAAERTVNAALTELDQAATPVAWRLDSPDWSQSFSDRIVRTIDSVFEAVNESKEQIDRLRVSLAEIAEEVFNLYRDIAHQQGVVLGMSIEHPGGPGSGTDGAASLYGIFARRDGLKDAFGEIIRNSCRHAFPAARAGSKETSITLGRLLDEDAVLVTVADNGCGMDERQLAGLDAGMSTSGGGYGYRLVRNVIEKEHLGRLKIQSAPGQGTCVEARFPRRLAGY
jgi:signal transduction histidine kinase